MNNGAVDAVLTRIRCPICKNTRSDACRSHKAQGEARWYDVYAASPQKESQPHEKPLNRRNKLPDKSTRGFCTAKMSSRGKFYETYGSSGIFHLYRKNFRSVCERFVETYTELQKTGEVAEDKLFDEASKALLAEGIILRRAGYSGVFVPRPLSSTLLGSKERGEYVVSCGSNYQKTASSAREYLRLPTPITDNRLEGRVSDLE
ncbi:unnamed protein product [Ranitomeya imitator]|uniref:Small ribosomal subunit protein mS23 conserved domain-containing protein n=1 Tax=Ranitomeya imitator TaxID=111125 RepID=A0ABN9LP03_9NEOB|nr:unnamed protein product [Ranitomeya imitator]